MEVEAGKPRFYSLGSISGADLIFLNLKFRPGEAGSNSRNFLKLPGGARTKSENKCKFRGG